LSSLKEDKNKLREEYKRRRDTFVSQMDAASRGLAFRRPPSPLANLFAQCDVIALYSAYGSEAPTASLIEYLAEMGKIIAFPVVMGSEPLEFRAVSNIDLLDVGYQNILEPPSTCDSVTPDLIVTPLTAFDRSLRRLGQGGGHYDRTFQKYPDAKRMGLAWSVQEAAEIPSEPHDVTLHGIVTERELIE